MQQEMKNEKKIQLSIYQKYEIREWRIFFTMRAKITTIKHSGYSIVVAKAEKIDSFSVRRDHKSCKYVVQRSDVSTRFWKKASEVLPSFLCLFLQKYVFCLFFYECNFVMFSRFFQSFYVHSHKLSINRVSTPKCFVFET